MAENKKVLLKVQNLKKHFPLKKRSIFQKEQLSIKANDGISIDIYEGETLGLVGESGCGKSTFGRTILQLYDQTEGNTLFYGRTLAEVAPKYVVDVIKTLSKHYPAYLADKKALDALVESRSKVSDDLDKSQLDSKIEKETARLENKYKNMFRIAGGLLTSSDLKKVSHVLLTEFKIKQKEAKIRRRLVKAEVQLTDPKVLANKATVGKVDEQIAKLKTELVLTHEEVEKASEQVKALKDTCRNNERFNLYEEQMDDGIDLSKLSTEEVRLLRQDIQIIFQDPYSSLNPRLTVGQIIGEGLLAHNFFKNSNSKDYTNYITDVMEKCGLAPYFIHRYPHQFSGGQRQRIGIARALALNPKFIVCDEAVSALDVSIQSQIINLLIDLKKDNNLTYLFITHDLSVVKFISDRIGVMYLGNMVELGSSDQIFANPLHPYTEALLEAIPRTDVESNQELTILEGDIPSPIKPPKGCKFHTRCKYAFDKCKVVEPIWQEIEPGHFVACHLRGE
jgi:oligopeptide/dipeptide ABC transporter ATP-binding protein